MSAEGYEPIDAGEGRRLERFASVVVDRPAPGAVEARREPSAWSRAWARFDRGAGWSFAEPLPSPWRLRLDDGAIELTLRAASAGQVGIFPEQRPVWDRLRIAVEERAGGGAEEDRVSVLNLFAYTGAATLIAGGAGASVAHVDASRTAVSWARANARASGLGDASIRWVAEDVPTYVAREARRGRRYDVVLLDPPSYGHGAGGRAWRIDRDLEPLLLRLTGILSARPALVALTAHGIDHTPARLTALLACFGQGTVASGPLELGSTSGARLRLGAFAWWTPT
jgi:23S rRNA (cytosine1962-C5)-methyltransferase